MRERLLQQAIIGLAVSLAAWVPAVLLPEMIGCCGRRAVPVPGRRSAPVSSLWRGQGLAGSCLGVASAMRPLLPAVPHAHATRVALRRRGGSPAGHGPTLG